MRPQLHRFLCFETELDYVRALVERNGHHDKVAVVLAGDLRAVDPDALAGGGAEREVRVQGAGRRDRGAKLYGPAAVYPAEVQKLLGNMTRRTEGAPMNPVLVDAAGE